MAVKVSTSASGARTAGYAGLQHCGSYSACPVCNATIAAHRQTEIEAALTAWHGQGGRVVLGTFTMRHRKGQALKTLWDGLSAAWRAMTHGRGWDADSLAFGTVELQERVRTLRRKSGPVRVVDHVMVGKIPWIRVVEVTVGDNGWHVHVHALMLVPGDTRKAQVKALEGSMFTRWQAALADLGLESWRTRGADLRLLEGDPSAELGDYFTKASYSGSMEVARGDLKTGRHGKTGAGRTPFQVLEDLVATGDAEDLDVWHEWERGSKGRRTVAWSYGLRADLLPTAVEVSDEELVEADAGGEVECQIERDVWRVIVQHRADFDVLRAFQDSTPAGWAALEPYLDAAGAGGPEHLAELLEASRVRHRRTPKGRTRPLVG